MAALRILARAVGAASSCADSARMLERAFVPSLLVRQTQLRWSSYKSSPTYTRPEDYTDYEITSNPNEWKYVENVLPYKVIPKPPTGDVELPSGWKPVRVLPTDNAYFVERTKSHMQPVYLDIAHRGLKKLTKIKNIQGDIWELERDIKGYIEDYTKRKIGSRINEFSGTIKFKGDHVSCVKMWMDEKGF